MQTIDSFSKEYRFLSNFWPCEVLLDGDLYTSTEHAFQAAKTLDLVERQTIRECRLASDAKKLGRTVTLRDDWEYAKDKIMLGLLRQKFRNPDLHAKLLATGNATLIEGNTWNDTYWGVCNGQGLNKLGLALMLVRSELI